MNFIHCFVLFVAIYESNIAYVECVDVDSLSGFTSMYLHPSSKLGSIVYNIYKDVVNGAVIGITSSGLLTRLCVSNTLAPKAANVVCNKLNYKDGKSYALLVSPGKANVSTQYEITSCDSSDCKVKPLGKVAAQCSNHRSDLFVMCLAKYKVDETKICETPNSCQLDEDENKLLRVNGKYLFCGRNRNFGVNEAKLFCRLLKKNDSYAKIIESLNYRGPLIGGFIKMNCSSTAKDLSDCSNMEINNKEGCTPEDSIGVHCPNSTKTESLNLPYVVCDTSQFMVVWNYTLSGDSVEALDNNKKCAEGKVTKSGNDTLLTVPILKCGMNATGNDSYIIYTFNVRRNYSSINGKLERDPDIFQVNCFLKRVNNASIGTIMIGSVPIDKGDGHIDTKFILEIFSDPDYTTKVSDPSGVVLGNSVYVRAKLVDPPPKVVILLQKCFVKTTQGTESLLIKNKCPEVGVQIYPINDIAMGFSYKTFKLNGEVPNVVCDISKCSKDDNLCDSVCRK